MSLMSSPGDRARCRWRFVQIVEEALLPRPRAAMAVGGHKEVGGRLPAAILGDNHFGSLIIFGTRYPSLTMGGCGHD